MYMYKCASINISNCKVSAVYSVYVPDKKYSNHLDILDLNDERDECYVYVVN